MVIGTLVSLVLCGVASARGFGPPVVYPAGDAPGSLAVGDFDLNGSGDVAVTNLLSNDVSVLLGNGDGTFRPTVNYPVGISPMAVAVTCKSVSDPTKNLVVANSGSNTVGILMGNGDGTFQPEVEYSVGTGLSPRAILVGDLKQDGNCDLVVANALGGTNNNGNIAVLFGNGDGTFQPAVNYDTLGAEPVSLTLSRPPLALAVSNFATNGVTIFRVDRNGVLYAEAEYQVGDGPTSITAWPIHPYSQTLTSLVTTNSGSNDITVLYPTGFGTFNHAKSFAAGAMPVAAAPGVLNDSNFLFGLAVANEGDNTVSVFPGKRGKPFLQKPTTFPTCSAPKFVTAARLRTQRAEDLIVTCTEGVGVMLNTGP